MTHGIHSEPKLSLSNPSYFLKQAERLLASGTEKILDVVATIGNEEETPVAFDPVRFRRQALRLAHNASDVWASTRFTEIANVIARRPDFPRQ